MAIISKSYQENMQFASHKLLSGDVIALPTETVYGLAGVINNPHAINKIYQLKNRPLNHPLIMHIAKVTDLYKYAINIPEYLDKLIENFWPGPLTFILNKSPNTPHYITGNQETVAIRMPNNKFTLDLINEINVPIAAPSANKFMGISPTQAQHVLSEFGDEVDVIDGGACVCGIESTIIDATQNDSFRVLRPGFITADELFIIHNNKYRVNILSSKEIAHSGNHKKHYSPHKPLLSYNSQDSLNNILTEHKNIVIISYSNLYDTKLASSILHIGDNSIDFARDFYHVLRVADEMADIDIIAIEEPPTTPDWLAIWDRLSKAKGTL